MISIIKLPVVLPFSVLPNLTKEGLVMGSFVRNATLVDLEMSNGQIVSILIGRLEKE